MWFLKGDLGSKMRVVLLRISETSANPFGNVRIRNKEPERAWQSICSVNTSSSWHPELRDKNQGNSHKSKWKIYLFSAARTTFDTNKQIPLFLRFWNFSSDTWSNKKRSGNWNLHARLFPCFGFSENETERHIKQPSKLIS